MSNIIDFESKDVTYTFSSISESVCNSAQEQEINDLMRFLKLEQTKYLHNKIIFDLIEDIINEDVIYSKLKTKAKDIILNENVKQISSLNNTKNNSMDITVLGVRQENSVLTYSDSITLQELLKTKLNDKSDNIALHEEWTDLAENIQQLESIQITANDKVLLEYRKKLNTEQQKYVTNLLNLQKLLGDITDTRIVILPGVLEDKFKECQLEQQINYSKFTLAQQKCKVDIFTETSCSLKAYKELFKDLKKQQEDWQKEIENLKDLKEKYKQISGKQYDDILKTYLQFKASLEKKKIFYNCLKS